MIQTDASRSPVDLGALVYQVGDIGRLTTLSVIPVIAGDSFEQNLVGSFKMSPMRRNLTLDCKIDILTFYVPHRHVYGDEWVDFMKAGIGTSSFPTKLNTDETIPMSACPTLAVSAWNPSNVYTKTLPSWAVLPYFHIYNNFFKIPADADVTSFPAGDERGLRCANIKNIWSADLPVDSQDENISISSNQLNVFDVQEKFAAFHTNQERLYFMERYRDIMDKFGGYANPDVDNRPTLLNRTSLYSSGYDVDGTTETTLGQYQGRVSTPYSHKVPRFYCPEHGSIWTVMVPRFDPVVFHEQNWLLSQTRPTYEILACDPTIVGNQQPFAAAFKDFFTQDVSGGGNIFVAHSQWYREHNNYVHPLYDQLQGYPFYDFKGDIVNDKKRHYVSPDKYDDVFQTMQLRHWQTQARNNVTVLRNIPTSRDAFMLSE